MGDERFAAAVKATGRTKFIVAGVTNDLCTALPALSVVREGCGVPAVADADGPPGTIGDGMVRRRTQGHGVALAGPSRIVRQPSGNWATPEGSQIAQVVTEAPLASA
ncbi:MULTISPECIES: hypothetical protein [Burkholderia]|uniref:hypothetical protein n=1 Tax=Burkholderia TaxID=32008 RepID=UPI00053185BE|nr:MULTISPECIES: hypothetical protein [Burkholderia]KGS04680.1 putative isochorismatase hydrolase protein [Burkholderia sp. ABCPW 111]